jgi:hypothetical protein
VDGAIYAPASQQAAVGCIDDYINLQFGDVALYQFDHIK